MIFLWLALAVLFFIVELITVGLISLWFTVGAFAALVAAALGAALWLQITVFVVVSAVCFLLLYPKLKRFVRRDQKPTNADMVIGQPCLVTRRIDNIAGTGTVSVGGKTWTARSLSGDPIEEGCLVRADSIEGVKLLVTPLPHDPTDN